MAPFNIIMFYFKVIKVNLSNELHLNLYPEIKLLAFYCPINVT